MALNGKEYATYECINNGQISTCAGIPTYFDKK